MALTFPYILRLLLVLGGLTVIFVSHITPPVFLKRFVHGFDILPRSISVTVMQTLCMIILMEITEENGDTKTELLIGALIFAILLLLERVFLYKYIKRSRSKGRNIRYVILVGHPWMLTDTYNLLMNKSLGFSIQGIFTRKELPKGMNLPILGNRHGVIDYLKEHPEVNDVYVVPDEDYKLESLEILQYCEDHTIRFYALPVLPVVLRRCMTLSHMGNTMLLSMRNEPLQNVSNRFVKRMFDIIISGLFLLTLFPIIYVIAGIIIKWQSPGPIIFKQKRNGLDGREFYCLKFRSMHVNKDADLVQATENDPRKFRFGDIMRRTNIDELPQFLNVFIGNMSLVGPRPHMLLHTQEYSRQVRQYMVRHMVKPGITGWAQVQGLRGETKSVEVMEERVKADIWYVENWSFCLDISIMWHTFLNMVCYKEKNAY